MDIRMEIARAVDKCKERSLRDPTAIYLGRNQVAEAIRFVKQHGCYSCTQPERLTFNGLPVYEVDADDHCTVA